jgi:hypothetical protein
MPKRFSTQITVDSSLMVTVVKELVNASSVLTIIASDTIRNGKGYRVIAHGITEDINRLTARLTNEISFSNSRNTQADIFFFEGEETATKAHHLRFTEKFEWLEIEVSNMVTSDLNLITDGVYKVFLNQIDETISITLINKLLRKENASIDTRLKESPSKSNRTGGGKDFENKGTKIVQAKTGRMIQKKAKDLLRRTMDDLDKNLPTCSGFAM